VLVHVCSPTCPEARLGLHQVLTMMSMLGPTHVLRPIGPGSNRDRGGGRRGCGGGHPGRAHKGGGQADAAAVFHREYGAAHLHDCEEEWTEVLGALATLRYNLQGIVSLQTPKTPLDQLLSQSRPKVELLAKSGYHSPLHQGRQPARVLISNSLDYFFAVKVIFSSLNR
jgi:hypothetical protein